MRKLILASASPRRQELLKDIISEFEIIPSFVEEVVPKEIKPLDTPAFLALLKARDISKNHAGDIVIGSDTIVIVDDMVLTKPSCEQDAFRMLRLLSGRKHIVCTGCALVCDEKECCFSVETQVEFYDLSDDEINDYISTGDCIDKAGAYGIQSQGKTLVKGIYGDYFNVVGLPVSRLKRELKTFIDTLAD